MERPLLTLYTKKECGLCEEAKSELEDLQSKYDFEWKEIDIYTDDALLMQYQLMIPVVEMDGETLDYGRIDTFLISKRLHMKKD
ncbi:glutaredoxin [Pontibacillus halophilus JSM 076056 = DSM 19796]|uniref:Glutaredoxin n=1 Tax=Pontibacillus halophilus JSM 076056 = DSM 19796 TaxID=1385510 RepID=A0A0A5GLM4_9BACI|nr:glutaredoxin family protein [Pontibacillus halophilus]KGX92899.1 glutaredoxin [Pontibacillus halophilus JSM 076056 = DSM 19796]